MATRVTLDRDAPERGRPGWGAWFAPVCFVAVAAVVFAVSVWAHAHLPPLHHRRYQTGHWAQAFSWWDGWWYVGIASRGYANFSRHVQSPVAFFPVYPMLMRLLGPLVGGPLVAGVVLTVTCGLGDAVLFHRWCQAKLGAERARLSLLVLLLFPFAFYLMGPVYADALFLLAALSAFLALEADRPLLAGVMAAVATAARPVGVALVVGLWVRALERRGVLRRWRTGLRTVWSDRFRRWGSLRAEQSEPSPRLRLVDAGLLLAPAGLVAYCMFLGFRFGHPFAFVEANGASGWRQAPGPRTWFKQHWLRVVLSPPYLDGQHAHMLGSAAVTMVVLGLVLVVFRRFGWGYGAFALVAVLGAAISTKDFVGMGRYSLAAFPCFAAAGDVLFGRRRLMWAILAGSAALLLLLAELHARGTLVSLPRHADSAAVHP